MPNDLEGRLARLEQEVEGLRAELHLQRASVSMRSAVRCPSCGGTTIVRATALQIADNMGGHRLAIQVNAPNWYSAPGTVPLELYACTACGLVEWYIAT